MSRLRSVVLLFLKVYLYFGTILSLVECGRNISQTMKINKPSDIKEAHYQATFVLHDPKELMTVVCGGVIVSIYQILTSANCAMEISDKNVTVQVGSVSAGYTGPGGSKHTITNIDFHQKFDKNVRLLVSSDVAMVQVKEPMVCNHCKVIDLADDKEALKPNSTVFVTGHGGIRSLEPLSKFRSNKTGLMRFMKLKIDVQKNCDLHYSHQFGKLSEDQRCGWPVSRDGPCVGDQGDPVVNRNKRLLGILVYASPLCSKVQPAIFIEIRHVRNWIDKLVAIASPWSASKILVATQEVARLKSNLSTLANSIRELSKNIDSLYDFLNGTSIVNNKV